MKAARLHRYGAPLALDEVPEPQVHDPRDVVVRMAAAGVCRSDLHVVDGMWAERTGVRLPYTLGHENAGWVADVGSAVGHLRPGDPVVLHPLMTCGRCSACRRGDDMRCATGTFTGAAADGGFAEYVRTTASAVVGLPDGMDPVVAAPLGDAGITAYHAVKRAAARVRPGDTVLVVGAGGLGHVGIQALRLLTSARIVVLEVARASADLARQLGADEVVMADGEHRAEIAELTAGRGPVAVLDFVGEQQAIDDSLAVLADSGTYLPVGYGGVISIPAIDVMARELTIVGNLVGTHTELAELVELVARGRITVDTTRYRLDAVNQALDDLRAGRVQGRAVLTLEAN